MDVQVVGTPSEKYGEEVAAFVIPKPGVDLTPEDVRDFCRGKIVRHKIPKHVALVEGFPLTASGKVKKFELRKIVMEMFPA